MYVLKAAESREVDRIAIEELGIPGLILMEHAAWGVAEVADAAGGGRIVVVCGGGNNGGDGYAAARLLVARGRAVEVISLSRSLAGDAAVNAEAWRRIGSCEESLSGLEALGGGDVVVDAIFGSGLSRAPEGLYAEAIEAIDRCRLRGAKVVAVDLPSGILTDDGQAPGAFVQADATVTFLAPKRAHLLADCGALHVVGLGTPPSILDRIAPNVRLLEESEVRRLLPPRAPFSHKGSFGHVLALAGSPGKSGAAALCGRAALVGGAGLVTVAARPAVVEAVLAHAMELMGWPLPEGDALGPADADAAIAALQGKDALLVGPGIPRGEETGRLVGRLLAEAECPVLLDADALNALAGQTALLKGAATDVVLTPHPGEMARLCCVSTGEVQADRIELPARFAMEHGCTVILKGRNTVIAAPTGEVAISPTGNAGLATAGTGDVLAGLVSALLSQGLSAFDAARAGVYVHGLAAEKMTRMRGERGLLAGDLLEGIGRVWAEWKR